MKTVKAALLYCIAVCALGESTAFSRPLRADSFPVQPTSQAQFKEYYLNNIMAITATDEGVDLRLNNHPPLSIRPDNDIYKEVLASARDNQIFHLPINRSVELFGDSFGLKIYPAPDALGKSGFIFQMDYAYWDEKTNDDILGKNRCIVLLLKPKGSPPDGKERKIYFLKYDLTAANRFLNEYSGDIPSK